MYYTILLPRRPAPPAVAGRFAKLQSCYASSVRHNLLSATTAAGLFRAGSLGSFVVPSPSTRHWQRSARDPARGQPPH